MRGIGRSLTATLAWLELTGCLCAAQDQPQKGAKHTFELPAIVTQSARLSLTEAITFGLKHNPLGNAAFWSTRSAHENYVSQRAPINPTLGYSGLNNTVAPANYSDGFSNGGNYILYVTLETSGAQRFRAAQARELFHQAEADAKTVENGIRQTIANAYVGLQTANRLLDVEMRIYENIAKLADLTEDRLKAGAGTQADATRARIAEIQEEQNVITCISSVQQGRANLDSALGRSTAEPIDVQQSLSFYPVVHESLADLTKHAERHRPELKSANANLRSLEALPGLQRSNYYPDLVLGRDFGGDGLIYIGLSLPIDLGQIRSSISKAEADAKVQKAQVREVEQGVELDVRSSFLAFEAARQQYETYRAGVLEKSESLVEQVKHGFELGANTIVDVLTAENTYRSVESAAVNALSGYILARYALLHAVGASPNGEVQSDFGKITDSQREEVQK